MIGFVVEIENLEVNVCKKLIFKNVDMIVVNNISVVGVGFFGDINIVIFYWKDGFSKVLLILDKKEVVEYIIKEIVNFLRK